MTRFRLRAWLNLVLCRVNGGRLDEKKKKEKGESMFRTSYLDKIKIENLG
jgi:hypothetical protein